MLYNMSLFAISQAMEELRSSHKEVIYISQIPQSILLCCAFSLSKLCVYQLLSI